MKKRPVPTPCDGGICFPEYGSVAARHHKFCTKCGRALPIHLVPQDEYDLDSGYQVYHARLRCVAKRHWWDGHEDFWLSKVDYDSICRVKFTCQGHEL